MTEDIEPDRAKCGHCPDSQSARGGTVLVPLMSKSMQKIVLHLWGCLIGDVLMKKKLMLTLRACTSCPALCAD